jgi:hypothetical protein
MPADFPLHDGTPYRGLHVYAAKVWDLSSFKGSIFCRAVQTP